MSKQIKKEFKALEDVIDQNLAKLSIWALPFQTVMSHLFYGIENIDLKGNADTAMDYTSRLSYLYQVIVDKAQSNHQSVQARHCVPLILPSMLKTSISSMLVPITACLCPSFIGAQ
jgi:hypothetical protein